TVRSVAVDSHDNIIVVGCFAGTVDFGGTTLTASDPYSMNVTDMFAAKYSPSGSLVWVRQFGGGGSDYGRAVAVDGGDNVIVVGGAQLQSAGGNGGGLALVKLSAAGTTLWAMSWGGPYSVSPWAMAI